ncbi:MAG: hypothetical protein GY805_13350, partial [Chloroflexi bacterium]|nr:hypothetical protein [Chloroflexota bacterium]
MMVAVLLLAFGLRVHNIEVQSFWNDEGNSARLSERSFQLIIEGTASDIHPPLYYLLLNQWRKLVGDSEFGLRSLSLFAGMLTVLLAFVLGRMVGGKRPYLNHEKAERGDLLGFLAAGLLAISPGMIYYSQEARMYALLGLWSILGTVLLLVISNRYSVIRGQSLVGGKQNLLLGGAYVLCAVAGLYTHYFFPAVLLVHNIFILFKIIQTTRRPLTINNLPFTIKNYIGGWAILMLITLLLYAPWLPIFLQQFSGDPIRRPQIVEFATAVSRWLTFGATIEIGVGFLWLVLGLLVVGLIYGRSKLLLPFLGVLLPLGMMFATGTTGPEFHKFLVVAAPFWLIWLGMAVTETGNHGWWFVAALVFLSWGMGQSLNNMYSDPSYARADYRSMAAR